MKRLIFVPSVCNITAGQVYSDRYHHLFSLLVENMGFELHYVSQVPVVNDAEIIIVYGPQHSWWDFGMPLLKINKNIPIIGYVADLWSWHVSPYEVNMPQMLNRYNVILSSCNYAFRTLYNEFMGKRVLFPNFYATKNRYDSIPFEKEKINKLLITGSCAGFFYPLRNHVLNGVPKANMDQLVATRETYDGDNYAKIISNYYCSLASSSIYNMAVTKYHEIAATGTLLIANNAEDVEMTGFKPNEHYVEINKENAVSKILDVLSNHEKYEHIRKAGMEYVRKNHSVNSRYEQLKTIINGLLKK